MIWYPANDTSANPYTASTLPVRPTAADELGAYPNSTVVSRGPRTTRAAATGISTTPVSRRLWDRSAVTRARSRRAAARLIRGRAPVITVTAMTAYGIWNSTVALAYAATVPVPAPEAIRVATTDITWAAAAEASVQPAIAAIRRMPTPRGSRCSRSRNPARRPAATRTAIWAATPAVVPPANSRTCGTVSVARSVVPPTRTYPSRTAMTTRLLTTGAHIGAAKRPRALST